MDDIQYRYGNVSVREIGTSERASERALWWCGLWNGWDVCMCVSAIMRMGLGLTNRGEVLLVPPLVVLVRSVSARVTLSGFPAARAEQSAGAAADLQQQTCSSQQPAASTHPPSHPAQATVLRGGIN